MVPLLAALCCSPGGNYGHVGTNVENAIVRSNLGTLETNEGLVEVNDGTVETNTEYGTISVNRSPGTVTTNYGHIVKCSDVYGIIDCTAVPKESPPTTCICKEQWSIDDYENCGVTQNGCEPTSCDGDAPWCEIKNPGCDDEVNGEGWAYCTTDGPTKTDDSAPSGSVQ